VVLGPFTAKVVAAAEWSSRHLKCPSSEKWAEEFERVFAFANGQSQFVNYFSRLTKSYSQFDSSLAELRIAYHLDQNGFPVVRWEPVAASGNAGEFVIRAGASDVFVEVKSPGWESELEPAEIAAGRARQPKYQDQGGSVEPWKAIRFAITKAYKKFDTGVPNLLVIADDLFVPLEIALDMYAERALYSRDGYFADSSCEKLGGIGIFWVTSDSEAVRHHMKLYENKSALPTAKLPDDLLARFT
jgi:hypothetical protein